MKTILKYQFSIICVLIFCFILSLAGCYSMQPETFDAKDINKQEDYEILSLVLKVSSKIENVEPSHINFIKGVPDSTGRFVHSIRHYANDSNISYIYNTLISTDTLPLFKVSKVTIDSDNSDLTLALILFGSILLVGSMLIIVGTNFFDGLKISGSR